MSDNRIDALVSSVQPKGLLRGLIPNPWTPSDALLDVELDVSNLFTQEEYMQWKEGLEDVLNELDVKYTLRQKGLRGRRVEAEYKTVLVGGQKNRIRMLKVQPYPSRFSSALGYVRTKFYGSPNIQGVLEKYSTILSEERRGRLIVQTRLVPEAMMPPLRKEVDGLNKEIDKLQSEIDGYETTGDFNTVKAYILNKVPADRWSKQPDILHGKMHHIQLNPWPIIASKDFIDSFTDEETRKEIRASITKIVLQTVESSQKELSDLTGKLAKALTEKLSKGELRDLDRSFERTKRMAIETNTYHLIKPKAEAIQSLIYAVVNADPGDDKIRIAAYSAARQLGVQATNNPIETLRAICDHLNKGIDPKIRNLVNQILGE